MIKVIPGFFDQLFLEEATISIGYGNGKYFIIPVSDLPVLGGHPLIEIGIGPYTGELIFIDVASSKRIISEYIGSPMNPDGFGERKEIMDHIDFAVPDTEELITFGFDGYLDSSPPAWIGDWVIRARAFEFKVFLDDE